MFEITDQTNPSLEDMLDRVHPDDRSTLIAKIEKAIAEDHDYQSTFRITLNEGGARWIKSHGRVVGEDPKRLLNVSFDVSPELELVEVRDMLIREMNHRIKNLFAVVSSMITLGARDFASATELAQDLRSRLSAMGRSHDLTQDHHTRDPAVLEELLHAVLAPAMRAQTISLKGPPVKVQPEKITPLTLILHEWATNAAKYGALASEKGKLAITWRIDEERLYLTWDETSQFSGDNGKAGFGTRLVNASVRQLGGKLEGAQAPGKFSRTLIFAFE